MNYSKMIALVNQYRLEKQLMKWAGIFRYLGACYSKKGFTLEKWLELNNEYIDSGLVESIFRILKENELQRYFEIVYEMTKLDINSFYREKQQSLLWTPPKEAFAPKDACKDYIYLNIWIQRLIQITEKRIIFFSPYYTISGIKKLFISIEALMKNRREVSIDFITNDININSNKQAFKFLLSRINKIDNNNLRLFQAKNKDKKDSFKFHAKLVLVDDNKGYMGSANFSKVALENVFELGIPLQKKQVHSLTKLIDYWIYNEIFNEIDLKNFEI
ncbi:phospholipase D-like domain-containing protein [Crassaminicella indica]|uniref:PLD phosphodiesterase domain-containing protein n=1 Tax=Crassaminicella indica TaxID=2855394 RepID=A0ABX8RG01_9CLOT|nr:phospholipase D-like domain-containing protein [Crassaminicella indica]QXM06625.1 hypothetical protein KVH43_02425 [Crassaminicella indica]